MKVSICIPSYKQTFYLARTLDSVFAQTYPDYEVVISDDSPNDSVWELVRRYPPGRIRYNRNASPKGSPGNWNHAVSLANGEYIKILHHDDWFPHEGCLARFVEALEDNPHADLAFSATNVCDRLGQLKIVHQFGRMAVERVLGNPSSLFYRNIVGAPSATIYRRSVSRLFDPALRWLADIHFYYFLLIENHSFVYIDSPCVCTTDGADHQVTAECLGDRTVEIKEWLYFAKQLREARGRLSLDQILFLSALFKKHRVSRPDDLKGIYTNAHADSSVKLALFLKKITPRSILERVVGKI
jgi:glycosyltransferase involved in cell wall biosynthesis